MHIYEHGLSSKLLDKSIVDAPGDIGTILAAIGNENLAHGSNCLDLP
jgi:hypothetical protein